jgi:hypothetical protein
MVWSTRERCVFALTLLALATATSCGPSAGGGCASGDGDGLNGGDFTFALTVSDTAFAPTILKAQNLAHVTLTMTNVGTKPHDFVIDCIPTPNSNGCPTTSCFVDAGIPPVAPDASATQSFATPNPEGIYTFRSDLPGDTQTTADGGTVGLVGQFIVQ